MYCPKCFAENSTGSMHCPRCGDSTVQAGASMKGSEAGLASDLHIYRRIGGFAGAAFFIFLAIFIAPAILENKFVAFGGLIAFSLFGRYVGGTVAKSANESI
jgi:hypothetical protein